jgi:hypothetical protein
MTQEEIIEMAKQVGFERLGHDEHDYVCYLEEIMAFAKLIAQHERNEIIEILDASTGYVHMDAIRDRGEA